VCVRARARARARACMRACVRACVRVCVVGLERKIIRYDLSPGQTIDSNLYNNWKDYAKQSKESDQNLSIRKASSSITTTPNPMSLATHQKLRERDWKVLMPPSYSSDLAPLDYYLFRSLQNSLHGVKLTSKEICKNHLSQFFVLS